MINHIKPRNKKTFSLNNPCIIISILKQYVQSQPIFKKAKKHGYLLFKLKSLKFRDPNRSCFVVSNQCQKFIISELGQQDYLQNFEIIIQPSL